MQRALIAIGLILLGIGLLWPWLQRSGLGRLPGDIVFERGSFRFYFPLATCLLVSVLLTLVLWLVRR
jgi:hypothetical protein